MTALITRVHNQSFEAQRPRYLSASSRQCEKQQHDLDNMMKLLPPKPEPPDNDDCCLSGCEFCVWDLYDEDMREYRKQAEAIRHAFESQGKEVPEQLRPESLHDAVNPTMRAFLDMEREMAMKIQHEEDMDRGEDDK
ncbi:hypothetical protein LPJ53_005253 [Coemansia erecta]|uniref:Oxidoreductase-like domain-containing protein n=1 Tax=Coemansia erecta TaxID=147472 RepID=A0A9W7XX76_9FUNG|nr:hypothetical protein LPJ53_005253 [Coemansia erecta]